MLYRILADGVMVVHFAFIMFVVVGTVLAWRWPALLWLHVPALAWGVGTVAIGFPCPLTPLEKGLRRLAGQGGYEGGFVDHYLENVVYPDEYSVVLRALAVVTIVAGYVGLRRRAGAAPHPGQAGGSERPSPERAPTAYPFSSPFPSSPSPSSPSAKGTSG